MTSIALHIRTAVLAAAAVVVCDNGEAALVWSGTAVETKAEPAQEKAVAEFVFRNVGGRAVRLVSLRPSCDCTIAKASKESFAPGEAGIVRVEFMFDGRLGRQEKTVTVTTDDPAAQPVELLLVVEIPELVAIRPRMLWWDANAKPEEQFLTITVAEPKKATVTEARCDDAQFVVALDPETKRGVYRLKVRPTDTTRPVRATIRLTTMLDGHPLVSVIYVAVR